MEIDAIQIQDYIRDKKELYSTLLSYIEQFDNDYIHFHRLIKLVEDKRICEDRDEFEHFLYLIVSISNDHHRIENFFNKIEQIINKYKDTIRQMYSNSQILNIFKSNKRILLYLIGNKILKNDIYIRSEIDQFFFPEGQKIDQDFEIKRHQGENDSNICVLIRQDLIKDFVILMNKSKISIEQKIESSLFETNRFLIERNPTLIEYASFFGSIQIFQYLLLN